MSNTPSKREQKSAIKRKTRGRRRRRRGRRSEGRRRNVGLAGRGEKSGACVRVLTTAG